MSTRDIFSAYDVNGDQQMSSKEFLQLLEELRLTISEAKALRIFAKCDKGGVGSLTLEEFKVCWKAICKSISKDAVSNTGVTEGSLAVGLLLSTCFIALLFCFVFFAVSAFGGQGSFGSSVRGLMAAAAAKLGGSVGKATAPDPSEESAAASDALAVLQNASAEVANVEPEDGED